MTARVAFRCAAAPQLAGPCGGQPCPRSAVLRGGAPGAHGCRCLPPPPWSPPRVTRPHRFQNSDGRRCLRVLGGGRRSRLARGEPGRWRKGAAGASRRPHHHAAASVGGGGAGEAPGGGRRWQSCDATRCGGRPRPSTLGRGPNTETARRACVPPAGAVRVQLPTDAPGARSRPPGRAARLRRCVLGLCGAT